MFYKIIETIITTYTAMSMQSKKMGLNLNIVLFLIGILFVAGIMLSPVQLQGVYIPQKVTQEERLQKLEVDVSTSKVTIEDTQKDISEIKQHVVNVDRKIDELKNILIQKER